MERRADAVVVGVSKHLLWISVMTKASLLIHIGYHKTATTWMQKRLFLPHHGYQQLFNQYVVFDLIVKPHGLVFDPRPAKEVIEQELTQIQSDEIGVISSEILSGHPFFGGRESDVFAKRLAEIAPDAHILISIRNQMRILPSVYMQYILRGGTMGYKQFFEGKADVAYPSFSPEHFEYHRLVKLYVELFGKKHVHVLTQESLQENETLALETLAQFSKNVQYKGLLAEARRPVGESYPEYAVPILRRINHVQISTLNPRPIVSFGRTPKGMYKLAGFVLKKPPLATMLRKYKPVSTYVKEKFSGHFAKSNQELSTLIGPGLDLSGYDGI